MKKAFFNIAVLVVSGLMGNSLGYSQTASYEDLLDHRSGFAKDVTGGAGGTVIEITEVGDAGWIQLRNAVHNKDNPKWIRFSPGLSGDILIDQWLTIGSNTTIDGRGANITFKGKNTTDELFVWGDTNVIVHNIRFFEMGTLYDHGTAFGITAGDMVWLDHCTFEHNSDESVTIGNEHEGRGSFTCRLTVSYCHWEKTIRAMLFGHNPDEGKNYMITVHHCSFLSGPAGEEEDGAMYRIPKLIHGKVHMYNSYIKDYQWRATAVQMGGQALLENNIYEAAQGAAMLCKGDSYYPEVGYICDAGNILRGGTTRVGPDSCYDCNKVFEASDYYTYKADPAGDDMVSIVLSFAGKSDEPQWITTSSPKSTRLNLTVAGVGEVRTFPARDSFYLKELVTLTAEDITLGNVFSGWDGDVSNTDNPLTFRMDVDKHVVANFREVPVYNLSTTVIGEGRVSANANGDYNEASEVKITAFPSWGYEFIYWEGDTSGSGNPITVSMDSSINITAVFTGATGIIDKNNHSGKYSLKSCPNPGTDHISIRYKLDKSVMVILTVINSTGQEVTVLVSRYQNPGEYNVVWNGTDASGNKSPQGMYIIKLLVGNAEVEFNKMIINR